MRSSLTTTSIRKVSGTVYAGVIGSLFTGVYDPFTLIGLDRSRLILVIFIAAHLALGASWRTMWCYALPPLFAAGGFVAAAAVHNPWIAVAVFIGTPTAVLLVAIGQALAAGARRIGVGRLAPVLIPVALFLVATAPLAEAARETYNLGTAPRLSRRVAQQLPLTVPALNSVCDRTLPASIRAELTLAGQTLIRETRRQGSSIVQASYLGADEDPGTHYELMTVRQLAEAQLEGLRAFPHCAPGLQSALRAAIG
jgi:hypothetical protein